MARTKYEECCVDVWREFDLIDPDFAKEIERFGLAEEGTAGWICSSPREGESSPAEFLVNGIRDRVLAKIENALSVDFG